MNGIKNPKDKTKKTAHKKNRVMSIDGTLMKEMLSGGAEELRSNIDEVNRLNVFPVPDGDTGDNMFSTVDSGLKAIEGLDTNNLAEVMHVLSHGMLLGARGNSGVILSQFFKGVADGFKNAESADPRALASALELGVKAAYKTVVTPTEGTILTVAREAVEYAVSKINPRTTIKSFFGDFVKELHAAVERTPESLPALKDAGVVDSGGAGLFYLMDGFNRVLKGEKSEGAKQKSKSETDIEADISAFKKKEIRISSFDENTNMIFSYCTELLVGLTRAKCDTDSFDTDALEDFLTSVGDSAAIVKSGNVVKIHVHTLAPDRVMNYMLKYGEFINVKVENMSLQHSEMLVKSEEKGQSGKQLFTKEENSFNSYRVYTSSTKSDKENQKRKKYGVVAVSNGKGCDELFKKLGANETINVKGGKNPSANDFLESASKTNAENVFIFPNNSNFILSAEQAAKMANGFSLHVIASKSIADGYAGLSVINFDCDSYEEIIKSVTQAQKNACVGAVFTAAKDTKCSGLKIKSGDVLGTIEKDIIAKGKGFIDTSLKICRKLLTGRYILTVFKGEYAKKSDCAAIEKKIKKYCPEAEIYLIDSGQDVFEYIFLAE